MASLIVDPSSLHIGNIVSVQACIVGYDKDPDTFETLIVVQFGNKQTVKVKQTAIISVLS